MKLAFVSKLSDKKLAQKIHPLASLPEVESIDLFRRQPFHGKKIHWRGLPLILKANPYLAEAGRLMRLLLSACRHDIIIGCHQKWHGVWAWLAGRIFHKPVIQVIIGDIDRARSHHWSWRAVMETDACAVRGAISQNLLRGYGYDKPIIVLHNQFQPPTVAAANEAKKYDLIAIGDYAAAKDYPWMLEIIVQLKKRHPEIKLAIVGRGHARHTQSLIEELNLDGNVSLLGPVFGDDLDQLILQSKALLLTSKTEGLPMVVIEAMSLGVPVFASAVGELPWLLEGELAEHLLKHGDTDKAVDKISAWLDGGKTIPPEKFRHRVEELSHLFTYEAIAGQWRELLKAAAENNSIQSPC